MTNNQNKNVRYISLVKKILDYRYKICGYTVAALKYNPTTYNVDISTVNVTVDELVKHKKYQGNLCINLALRGDTPVVYRTNRSKGQLLKIVELVRELMEINYGTGTDLAGHCIEASELIVKLCQIYGIHEAKSVEGWVIFDDKDYGSDRPYDPHTWVEVGNYYIDVTGDQFNVAMYDGNEFKPVTIIKGRPSNVVIDEPKYLLDECECMY